MSDVEGKFFIATNPTVTFKIPKRFLPIAARRDTQGIVCDLRGIEPESKRRELYDKWVTARLLADYPDADSLLTEIETTPDLKEFYRLHNINEDAIKTYHLLGIIPHVTPPHQRVSWDSPGIGYNNIPYRTKELHKNWYEANPAMFFQVDTGWFEFANLYNYHDPGVSNSYKMLSLRHRKACMYSEIFCNLVNTNHKRQGIAREPNEPVIRLVADICLHSERVDILNPVISVYFDQLEIGFTYDMTSGEYTDIGDPLEIDAMELDVDLRYSFLFRTAGRGEDRGYNKTIRKGQRFSDLFEQNLALVVASIMLDGAYGWSDAISSDLPIPFGAIAGCGRNLGQYVPTEESPTTGVFLNGNPTNHRLVDMLRTTTSVGTVLRHNGLALTTTSVAVKGEEHHLLEMAGTKKTIVPTQRSRWSSAPAIHRLVYTPAIAEEFKSYLVEGQEADANRASIEPGVTQWEFLMSLGSIVEDYTTWTHAQKKADQKAIRTWERLNDPLTLDWCPFPSAIKVELEVCP